MTTITTNGHALRAVINRWELRKKVISTLFEGSLWKFPDEEKQSPLALAEQFMTIERAIAALETSQARYNLRVSVDVNGARMSLSHAVKSVGGASRMEAMWRSAIGEKRNSYSHASEQTRRTDEIHSIRTLSIEEVLTKASEAAAYAAALRAAIAIANSTEIALDAIELLDPKLLTE